MRNAVIAILVCIGVLYILAPWRSSPGDQVDDDSAVTPAAPPPPAAAPKVVVTVPLAPTAHTNQDPWKPASIDLASPTPAQTVQMGYCMAAGCELSFTLTAPAPDAVVVFEPAQAGKQTWRTPTELVFTPAKGALLAGHEVTVTIPALGFSEKLTVPYFEAAGKVASWPVEPGKPRFVAFLNGFVSQLGRGALYALYDQPVDAGVIQRGANVTVGGKRLAVDVRRPTTSAQVYDYPIPLANVVTLNFEQLPADGERLHIELPSRDDTGAASTFAKDLLVNTTLTATGFVDDSSDGTKGRRSRIDTAWRVPFTNQITPKQFASHVTVTPKPKWMSTSVWTTDGVIRARLDPGVLYTVTVAEGVRDVLGNTLRTPLTATFRAQDLPPTLALPKESLVLEAGRAKLPIQTLNLASAKVTTQKFAHAADWLAARSGDQACTGTEADIDLVANLNAKSQRELTLEPGLYCVAVTAKGRGSEGGSADLTATTYVAVSALGITAKVSDHAVFAWTTRLSDGAPVATARVALVDPDGKQLASATTASDGTVQFTDVAFATATGLSQKALLVVDDGELVAPLEDSHLSHARQYGLDARAADASALAAAVFTERGVYRPGESVHVKALVRDSDTYKPATGKVNVQITDPRGEHVATADVDLDSFGGAKYELALGQSAKVGEYTVRVSAGSRAAVRAFRVEEYRVPTFAVSVETDEPWLANTPARAAVVATYLHGAALAGRDLKYEVSRVPEPFAPAGFRNFAFDTSALIGAQPRAAESLTRGAVKLDGTGRYVVNLKPDHGSKAGPMRYIVDATVSDVDRQVYTGKLTRVVHPADVYVGVGLPSRVVVAAGDTVTVPIVAVAPDGTPRGGVDVTATLERVDYQTFVRVAEEGTQQLNRPKTTAVKRCAITTVAARAVECKLAVAEAGEYLVRAAALDSKRRPVEAAFRISASGGTTVAWPRFDHERIQVVADKPSYKPGDVARLVIQSPFPKARGLLTLERNGVIEHRLFAIDNDTPELRIPITAEQVPNVYASVVLVRGRIHDEVDATGFQTGAPAFRMGYAQLRVDPKANRLDVAVTSAPKTFPGANLAVDLLVRDADGKPRAGQATVMVVDEAVLGLTRFKTPDPIAEIFTDVALGVRTGESRLDLLNSRRSRRELVFPGGDGGSVPAALTEAAREPDQLPNDMRRLFKSTAYYNTDVAVGADGRAHVAFNLPDNVTTYRVMAVVGDRDTHVGAGQASVLARKPLIVQPALPRFLHPGDKLRIEARVFNGTDAKGNVTLAPSFANVKLDGPASATVEAAANGEARYAFPITVADDAHGEAVLKFAASMGSYTDSLQVVLPILDSGSQRKVVLQKRIEAREKLVLPLPPDRLAGSMQFELTVSTTALGQLKGAVDYLMHYPNGCIEQTTSTAYPLVVLEDLLPEMGVTVDQKQLRLYSEAGVRRVLSFQTSSGGLSYWPGSDTPQAYATAFGLSVLIEAKHRGYEVPDAALGRMADYLERALRNGLIGGDMPHGGWADADTRAYFVMTLGRLGRPQASYVSTLWDKRAALTPFGLAFLGIAVAEGAGDKALLDPILDAVKKAATIQPAEAYFDRNTSASGWSFDSPLRTHGVALLAYAGAGIDAVLANKLLTGLLSRQINGMWGNTQENVFGIMGVARYVGRSPDKPTFSVKINGTAIDPSRIKPTTDNLRRLVLTNAEIEKGNDLTVEIENGGKPVFATIRVDYVAKLDPKNRAALASGYTVSRRYEALDGTSLEGKKLKLGSLVRVRVRVDAASANHYVAIDDKLPAGLEPLNAALATTETVAAGRSTPELQRALSRLSYSELRDSRVAFYIDDMPAGAYEFAYVARATTPGTFLRPAAYAEAMYKTEVHGSSSIDDITIE